MTINIIASITDANTIQASVSENISLINTVIPLISAFIGAIIGGLFSLLAILYAHKKELCRQEKIKKEKLKAFCQGIYSEIEINYKSYMNGLGGQLKDIKEDSYAAEIIGFYFNFPVYNSLSCLVSDIPYEKLRDLIIRTYANFKFLESTVERHCYEFRECRPLYVKSKIGTLSSEEKELFELKEGLLISSTQFLKLHDENLTNCRNQLLDELQRFINQP
jgi:hypothetical protein